ncbi:NAD(P)/FAD-dependent oxidoreductase [Polyangium sp. y55x31]|uniref:flavin monoamine oxidase family protein n=1 Tax=Polyangium sp. y55x31 TaxID=3042688 RepID=UPI002482E07A|nr:NAD(P)/FAD-dependent oxidoreductase [Polyangium sp. y55x31]MDI1480844.1 NAD(P)/FAD-dependent oxidoreductase [Polyangium sp. y55x31]
MARTPLLRSLRKLASEHHAARARGLTPAALREERMAARERDAHRGISLDRRHFLGASAAGALTLALPRALRAADRPTIVIVGGGIAGLTCALALRDRGLSATVYEASGRIGGRMFSNTTSWDAGQVSEWCGELIDSNHRTLFALARRFGLTVDSLEGPKPSGLEDTYFFEGRYYPVAEAERDFARLYPALLSDLRAAGETTTYDGATAAGRALDQMSVFDWIASRVPGGHASPLGQLLDVAYVIEWGADSRDQSALNLVYLLGHQPDPDHFSMFGESDEAYHIKGGNQQIPIAIADVLGPDAIRRGHRLLRLRESPAGRQILTFQRGPNVIDVVADWVVLALPFAVLRTIDLLGAGFDARKRLAIEELGRGHNGKLHLQFSRRYWRDEGPWPGRSNGSTYADTGYQNTWEVSRAQPGEPGILVVYTGGAVTDAMATRRPFATIDDAGVRADARAGLGWLERVLKGSFTHWNGRATQSMPHTNPLYEASYSYYRVGQRVLFGGHEAARQGGVLFCGEHTSLDFQGHMEGAASQGARAAGELARLMG